MQRYGWQARNSRSKVSQTSQTNPNQPDSNINQSQTTSAIGSSQSKNLTQAPGSQRGRALEAQGQLLQNQGRLTKVSSISSSPLFQGLDIVPPRKIQSRASQPLQTQNFPRGKEDHNQAFSQSMSQASSQGSRLMARTNRNRLQNVQQQQPHPQPGDSGGNYQQNQVVTNVAESKNMRKKQQSMRVQRQATHTQASKFQSEEQIPGLRFNKTSKKSQSLLQMQNNPPATQRLPAASRYPGQSGSTTRAAQSRRPLATQRKAGDDLIDDLLGNTKRVVASKSSRIQSEVSDLDNSSNVQAPKVQRYGYGRRQATPQSQHVQLKKQISQKEDQTELTRSRNISIKSNIETTKFQSTKKDRQEKQYSIKSGSNYQTPISKLTKGTPIRQSHTSEFQIIPKRKSSIIIFSLANLWRRKSNQYFATLKHAKQLRQYDTRIGLIYLSRLDKIIKNKTHELCAHAFNKLNQPKALTYSFQQNASRIRKNSKIDNNANYKIVLARKIYYLFKNNLSSSFEKIKKLPQKSYSQLINSIILFEKKVIRNSFNRINKISKYNVHRNENYTKMIVINLEQVLLKKLKKSFQKMICFSNGHSLNDQSEKFKIQQSTQRIAEQDLVFESPIPPRHERAISNFQTFIHSSQSKKQISAEQAGEIKSFKQSIRKTTMAEDTRALKLEKELKQASKQNDKQVSNLQFRIEEMKQIISEYNFQLDYKSMRKKQLEQIVGAIPKQEESMDRDRSIISSMLKLPALTQLYFIVARNPNPHIEINELASAAYKNIEFSSQLDESTQSWLLMLHNSTLKKQIEAYEHNLQSEDHPPEERKKTAWLYAYQEQEIINKLVRSYVKQLYYWASVKSTLARVTLDQKQQ